MVVTHDMKWNGHDVSVELNATHGIQTNKKKITNLFSRRAFPMTPGDGVPDDASPSQVFLEMWIIHEQEEVNTSEEQTKSSQMAQVK